MALIPIKLKVLYTPPPPKKDKGEQEQDELFERLEISRPTGPVRPNEIVTHEDCNLNYHVLQNAMMVGKYNKEIFITFVGGYQIACKYKKATLDLLNHYMGQ